MLIRHAIPVKRRVEHGPADPDLSEQGRSQVNLLVDYLSTERIAAVYSSPLKRAHQTASPLAVRLGQGVQVVDGVAEFDRDSNEYVPVEELKASNDPRWREMVERGYFNADHEEREFQSRVVESIEGLIGRHPSESIAVVCHGGVINAYLAHVLGILDRGPFFYPNYTSIHRIAAARTGERAVVTINETSHLRGSGLPIGLHHRESNQSDGTERPTG